MSIEAQICIGYHNSLDAVQHAITGLRSTHLWGIILVGDTVEGKRLFEIVPNAGGLSYKACQRRLKRIMERGWIYKADKCYYLTPQGKEVYTIFMERADIEFAGVRKHILKQVQKRLLHTPPV